MATKLVFLTVVVAMVACDREVNSNATAPSSPPPTAGFQLKDERVRELREKYQDYLLWSKTHQDRFGFIGDHCDSLLFTALYASAGGEADVNAAEDSSSPGKWHRHPNQDCYPTHSKSSISRDMLIGLAWYLWESRQVAAIQSLLQYGQRNNWVMGHAVDAETRINRATMSPALIASYFDVRFALNGMDNDLRRVPMPWVLEQPGYALHVQVLHVLLRGLVNRRLTGPERGILRGAASAQSNNALFLLATSFFDEPALRTRALDVLLDKSLFPREHLPSTAERCEEWLWQRDQRTASWRPCPETKQMHSGGDFIFAAWLLLNNLSTEYPAPPNEPTTAIEAAKIHDATTTLTK